MVKKKKENPLLALLKQSASGWGKAIGYMWTGQWAKDTSRAVHRSGSGKRAVQRARATPKRVATPQSSGSSMSSAEFYKPDSKATNGAAINSAIRNAQIAASKQVTRHAHKRIGTEGVKQHKVKVTPAKKRAKMAQILSAHQEFEKANPKAASNRQANHDARSAIEEKYGTAKW